MSELVQVTEVEDGVVWVVLDRPQKKNALSIELRDEVSDALDRLTSDEDGTGRGLGGAKETPSAPGST